MIETNEYILYDKPERIADFTIPLRPYIKKNSQQIVYSKKNNRPFIIQNSNYLKYEKDCEYFVPKLSINYPVNIKTVFYMPTRRRVDLSNLLEGIHDILTKYGCIEDDNCNIIYSTDGSKVLYDHDNPRTEIEITKIDVTTIKDMDNDKSVSKKEKINGK